MYEIAQKLLPKKSVAELRKLTTANIATLLLGLFKNHIGRDNAIKRSKLFKQIFKKPETDSLEDWLRWEFVRKAMHLCRQRTKCFIASAKGKNEWEFYVIETEEDAEPYIDILNKNIKRMRYMQRRALQSVKENWSQLHWLDDKAKKQLK